MNNSQSTGRNTDTLFADDIASDAMVANVTPPSEISPAEMETMKNSPSVVCTADKR
jgi:hypothetical protein